VERFYDPLSGAIKLDGVDIKNLNIKWLRTQIGLVLQEPTLFATTIQENVAQGLIGTEFEGSPEEKKIALVKDACIKANADRFISNLPLGYNTMVGESGIFTSGGQKQLIAIARAIVGDPKILLLDEATSALDTQSESIVQDALNRAAAGKTNINLPGIFNPNDSSLLGRTTVIIAHRLSTVKDADRIFVVGDGLVLEHGTHSQLLGNPDGPYSCLVTAQNLRNQSEVTTKKSENASAVSDEAEEMQTVAEDIVCRNTTHTLTKNGERGNEYGHETVPEYNLLYMVKRIGGLKLAGWLSYGCGIIAAFCE
jgi:ATP-binding cassette subfamily B (MDR/TAP) protein 1